MAEYLKILDNSLLQKFNVKLYGSNYTIYDIINDFLEDNKSEKPFYLIDLAEVVSAFNKWNKLLPNIKPYYAIKSNPNLAIIEALASLGVYFDCASEAEIKTIIVLKFIRSFNLAFLYCHPAVPNLSRATEPFSSP
jgi:hypothetical protein